jgi:hypothetical protein
MEFKIEKGVPMPTLRTAYKRLPLDKMEIGDSIFVPGMSSKGGGSNSAVGYWGKRLNAKFVRRAEKVDGVQGLRIWRVE